MNWNKTELFGENILLMGVIVTDVEAPNHVATRENMKELEQIVIELQQFMMKNNIDAVNVSWAGIKVMKKAQTTVNLTVDKSKPN